MEERGGGGGGRGGGGGGVEERKRGERHRLDFYPEKRGHLVLLIEVE